MVRLLRASRPVLQRVIVNTAAAWDPVDASGEGTRAEVAQLGPGHAVGSDTGATPGFLSYERQQLFIAASEKAEYCQGHLLNADWGGPGNDSKNLTAFPQRPTNLDHKNHVENVIRNQLLTGKWFRYEVRIGYGTASVKYLLKRLGYDPTDPTDCTQFDTDYGTTGITSAAAEFRFANKLTAEWHELDATTGAQLVGTDKRAVFDIPSPLSFVSTQKRRKEIYPGKPFKTWKQTEHITKYKQQQSADVTSAGATTSHRPYTEPTSWAGLRDAQANTIDAVKNVPTDDYGKRVTHYQLGWQDARNGVAGTHYGMAYTAGRSDYLAGVAAARAGVPAPVIVGQAKGHKDYLAGIAAARANPALVPPRRGAATAHGDYTTGAGHAQASVANLDGAAPPHRGAELGFGDYRAGVQAARAGGADDPARSAYHSGFTHFRNGATACKAQTDAGTLPSAAVPASAESGYLRGFHVFAGGQTAHGNPLSVAPVQADEAAGHGSYLLGLTAARASLTVPPVGDAVAGGAHAGYVSAYQAARVNLATPAPVDRAPAAGHADYLAGVAAARANLNAPAPPESAAAQGRDDYRAGAAQARINLTGAPPVESGAAQAFADYGQGVAALRVSAADDPTRSAFSLGYTDCAAGLNALQVAVHSGTAPAAAVPAQAESGYLNGFNYGVGAATAHTDAASVAPVDLDQAAGHGDYGAGLAAARTNLASPPEQGAGTAHAGYLIGYRAARADLSSPAPPGTAAATGHADYLRGFRAAQADLGSAAPADSAAAQGHADYTAGAAHARATIANLDGAKPPESAAAEGFSDYRDGVAAARAGRATDARSAFDQGHSDFQAGWVDLDAQGQAGTSLAAAVPTRAESGYLRGFDYARGGVAAHIGTGVPTPGADVATGHGDYGAGLIAARADLVTAPGDGAGRAGAVAHAAYVAGYQAARVSLASVAPATAAGQAGHGDYRAGVDAARANLGSPAPAESAAAAGNADYLRGAAQARSTLAALDGVAPAPSGEAAGFGDYRDGVTAGKAAGPNDPTRSAFAQGLGDFVVGAQAADAQIQAGTQPSAVAPGQAESGYLRGLHYFAGTAAAHRATPLPADPEQAAGHGDYAVGLAAARANLASGVPAVGQAAALAHGGYLAGHNAARASLISAAPPGHAAATGHLDYISGYTVACVNLASAAPLESAAASGHGDYRNGCLAAAANLAVAVPPESAAAAARAEYLAGYQTAQADLTSAPPPTSAGARGHADYAQAVTATHQAHLTTGVPPVFFAGTAAASALADYITGVTAAQTIQAAPPPNTAAHQGFTWANVPSGSKRKAL